jgi:hypothetical protein
MQYYENAFAHWDDATRFAAGGGRHATAPDAPGEPQDVACSLPLRYASGLDDSLGHPLGQVGDVESPCASAR